MALAALADAVGEGVGTRLLFAITPAPGGAGQLQRHMRLGCRPPALRSRWPFALQAREDKDP